MRKKMPYHLKVDFIKHTAYTGVLQAFQAVIQVANHILDKLPITAMRHYKRVINSTICKYDNNAIFLELPVQVKIYTSCRSSNSWVIKQRECVTSMHVIV